LSKILLIDQMMITANPNWSAQEKKTRRDLHACVAFTKPSMLAGPDGVKTTEGFITDVHPGAIPARCWPVICQNLKMPRQYARICFSIIPPTTGAT
jgi:hypothetical protein